MFAVCLPFLIGAAVLPILPSVGLASGFDHKVSRDESGVWNPNLYRGLLGAVAAADFGGALWEGSGTRFGKTLRQTLDSQFLAISSATVMKVVFTRERPSDTGEPYVGRTFYTDDDY